MRTTRLYRLWCWIWHGHSIPEAGVDVWVCEKCGEVLLKDK